MKKDQITKNFATTSAPTVADAIKVLKGAVKGKFDHTFECQIALKLPVKNRKDAVRVSVIPPNSFSKPIKVVVLTDAQNAQTAKDASADYVGLEDMVEKIMGGWSDFDIVIATPSVMPQIAKLGKVLGPKGLMPNPRNETVTTDLKKSIESYKKGKLDYKMTESNQIAFKFGKFSMDDEKLIQNYEAFLDALKSETAKYTGNVFSKIYIKTSMSPSIEIKA